MNRRVNIKEDDIYFYNKMRVNVKVLTIRREANERRGLGKVNDRCPFCKKEILLNDEVYFSISNKKIIPNKIVHVSCIEGKTDKELVEEILKLQEEYKNFIKSKYVWG